MRRIVALYYSGLTAGEVGKAIGRTAHLVRNYAASRGVLVSRSETVVTYAVQMTVEHRATLRALAERHGMMNDVQMLEHLITSCLSGEGRIARYVTNNPDGAERALVRAFTVAAPGAGARNA